MKEASFWARVVKTDECWIWTGSKRLNRYGTVWLTKKTATTAHRFSYMLAGGVIPDGYQIDHLCRNRECVRPSHLEAVTPAENSRRAAALKTHCIAGHPFSGENLRMVGNTRICMECRRTRQRTARAKTKGTGPGSGSYQRNKTHCPQGHPYDDVNTYVTKDGKRMCRECARARGRKAA